MKRVVVTGMGMINALGHDKESSFKAICDGECGIDMITIFDASLQSVQIAGEVKGFDPATVMHPKEVKKADRFIHFGLKAAQEAMADANLNDDIDKDRFGISAAAGIGGLAAIEASSIILETKGTSPYLSFLYPLSTCKYVRWFRLYRTRTQRSKPFKCNCMCCGNSRD